MMFLKTTLLHLLLSTAISRVAADLLRASTSNGFNFFFFGDWGDLVPANQSQSGINFEQAKVAAQINKFATTIKPAFFVALGDNFYELGVNSTKDALWSKYYSNVYTAKATFVPWYPIFGNHDYYGQSPQPQIDFYQENRDSRWTFPDYQYTRTWNIPGTSRTLEIIFINTVTLCPESKSIPIGFPANPTDAFPNPNKASATINQYIWQPTLQWISNALKASNADYLLVAGHYHVYTDSVGDSGSPEASCLQSRLVPLMKEYGVAAYLNGHKHNFEHHFTDGIHYLTVGHGSDKDDPVLGAKRNGLLYSKDVGGFANFQVTTNNLNLKYIDENGKTIYTYSIPYEPRSTTLVPGLSDAPSYIPSSFPSGPTAPSRAPTVPASRPSSADSRPSSADSRPSSAVSRPSSAASPPSSAASPPSSAASMGANASLFLASLLVPAAYLFGSLMI